MWGILIAIVAAMMYALGGVLQHRVISSSSGGAFDGRGLAAGARKPLWLIGLLVMGAGVLIQLVALSMAELVIVQTIMVSMMVWVLAFAVLFEHVRLGRAEIAGSVILMIGVVSFILALQPGPQGTGADLSGWGIATAVIIGLAALLTMVATRLGSGAAAATLGTGSGMVNVLGAGLAAASLQIMNTDGPVAMFETWLPYAAGIIIALSVVLTAMAFGAGPVTAAIPPMIAANPVIGFVLGVTLLGETVSTNPANVVPAAAALIVMVLGIVRLARSKVIADQFAGG